VKPANILLENGIERVKLTDFGLARAADDASLTRSGTIAGTPQYMSPEQARGETVDARSDLFSLGTVLYSMLTGHSPFRADSALAVLKRVCDDPPRPIREVNPDVPEWLAVLITRLLAKDPADRPASAQGVADQLGHYLWQLQQPGAAALRESPVQPQARQVAGEAAASAVAAPVSADVGKRIDRIAYAHLAMLVLSVVGFIAAIAVFFETYRSRAGSSQDMALGAFVIAWVLGLSFPIPLATALLALRRASYVVLMAGTLLTLASAALFNLACWPIAMGLMVWVLVELQRDDVRAALAAAKKPSSPERPNAPAPSFSSVPVNANPPIPEERALLAKPPVLAKPAPPNPFADAPPRPAAVAWPRWSWAARSFSRGS
jgi:hypothetical protein